MNLKQSPKIILITGASSGLGEAAANYLAGKGHIVYGASRSIKPNDGKFHTLIMDVTDEASVKCAVEKIIEEQGRVDVLINNAGMVMIGPVEFSSAQDMETIFRVNVFGAMNMVKGVLPYMRGQKSGLIINISSLAAANGLPYRGCYSASKAAIERLTESLRLELVPFGLQACFVEPGDFSCTNLMDNTIITKDNGVYHETKTRDWIGELIDKGKEPIKLAMLIERIVMSKKVKSYYRIGSLTEKLSASLKSIIPQYLMEKMIKIYFKL